MADEGGAEFGAGGSVELITLPLSLFCTNSRRDRREVPSLGGRTSERSATKLFAWSRKGRENFRTENFRSYPHPLKSHVNHARQENIIVFISKYYVRIKKRDQFRGCFRRLLPLDDPWAHCSRCRRMHELESPRRIELPPN